MRAASSGSTSSAIRAAARLRSPSPPSTATDSSVSRCSNRPGPATTGRRKKTPCGGDSRRSRRCRPRSSWRDSCGCSSRPVWSHHHRRKARRHRGWRSGQRGYEPSSTRSTTAISTSKRCAVFARPVYFALGGRSNPDYYGLMAARLAAIFPDFTIETFPERHHFDPPHRIEPEHVARSLLALWQARRS